MTDASGDTALHKAVRSQHLDVVKLLVKEDPEFEFPANHAQETPLYLAAESGIIDILREILEECKNPNYAAGPLRRTPLHAAVVLEYSDCARLLWQKNKSLCEEPDEWGWNSLHYAVKLGLDEVVSDMLQWKKSLAYLPAGSENDWTTTFHIAASTHKGNLIHELLKHCPDCWEMLNSRGQNVLHVAVLNNQKMLLSDLLKSKKWGSSLVDKPDNDGNTPLHLLADSLNDIPEELRRHPKAKKMSFNIDNQTPRDIILRTDTSKLKEAINRIGSLDNFNCGRFGRRGFEMQPQEQDKCTRLNNCNIDDLNKRVNKSTMERAQIHLVVAVLLMTITFAAGFTFPGGFESDPNSSNKGMAVLIHKTAFHAFVVSDAIAFACSAAAVLNYFFMAIINDLVSDEFAPVAMMRLDGIAAILQLLAMSAVVIAFIIGLYATLAHSLGLAITVCAIGCVSFLLYVVDIVRLLIGLSI